MTNEAKLIAENNRLQSKCAKLGLELEQIKKEHQPTRKAYLELLELAMEYRERLGLENVHFEYDWMDKANLL